MTEKRKASILEKFDVTSKSAEQTILKHFLSRKYKITDERTIKYDSPTGKAYVGVGKRPFTEVTNGFGYKGVLMQTDNRQFIQCHVCGKWMRQIKKNHLEKHKITATQYRKKFGLLSTKALVSDALSYSLEERGRKNIAKFNLKTEEAQKSRLKALKARKHRRLIYNDEHNNKYAICQKQLGFRLLEYMKQYQILPNRGQKGEGRLIAKALFRRFGSLNNAFKHYEVPQIYRNGTNVELVAPNQKQLFFNYNKDYNRLHVWHWMLENTPALSLPNKFRD